MTMDWVIYIFISLCMTGLVCYLWSKFLALPLIRWAQSDQRSWSVKKPDQTGIIILKQLFIIIICLMVALPPFTLIIWAFGKFEFLIA